MASLVEACGETTRKPARPGAWLLTTARRKAIDRLRREDKRDRKEEAAQLLVVGDGDDGDDE